MPQISILSSFKKAVKGNSDQEIDDSPVKKPGSCKRKAYIESSDEEEENDNGGKSPNKQLSENEDSVKSNPHKKLKKESPESKKDEVARSKFRKAFTSAVNDSSSIELPKKMEVDCVQEKQSPAKKTECDETASKSLFVEITDKPEVIPRRKTARKQIPQNNLIHKTLASKASENKLCKEPNDSASENTSLAKTDSELAKTLKSTKSEVSKTKNRTLRRHEDTLEQPTIKLFKANDNCDELTRTELKESATEDAEGDLASDGKLSKSIELSKFKRKLGVDESEKKKSKTNAKDSENKSGILDDDDGEEKKSKSKARDPENKSGILDEDDSEENKSKSKVKDPENGSGKLVVDENEGMQSRIKVKDSENRNEKQLSIANFFVPLKKTEKLDSKQEKDSTIEDEIEKKNTALNKSSKASCKAVNREKKEPDNAYDPSKNNYHPINDACWRKNEKVPYLALAKTLVLIENTSGRLKTIEILSNFFRSVIALSPNDLLQSVYLCLNRLAPEYEGIELGVGDTLLMKAVAQATGRTVEKLKAEVALKGDLGIVSESCRGNQRVMFAPPRLTITSVFNRFLEIAKMSGNAAMLKKVDKIHSLFVACRDCEAKYIIRSLSGKLRIGLAEQSVLAALARAAVLTPPEQPDVLNGSKGLSADNFKQLLESQTLILKSGYCECPNYDMIIPVFLKHGLSALPKYCHILPGRPVKPMLAHPTTGIKEVLERFDKASFTCEFKYDGERAQIHMTKDHEIKIFSRNQEDNTSKYPDVISRLHENVKEGTKSFILDSEAVAYDKEKKQILPFQVLSTRKRKDAVESEIAVQVCIMAFDLLFLNGESLVKKSLKERRELLHSSFIEIESKFMFAQHQDGTSAETMQEFLDESIKGSCEGLMVKSLEVNASYEIAKRSHNWLKLKKDYLEGVGDTLDLVVIGGYYGKGKRTGSYGGFLLACYDEENEEFQSICKLGTGFKDEDLEDHISFFKNHVIDQAKSYYRYDNSVKPDVWFEPVQMWEVKCADLSISPVHKAAVGIVDPEKGISLRFPRFIRIRDDKAVEDCTSSTQVAEMYQKQEQIQNVKSNRKVEEGYY